MFSPRPYTAEYFLIQLHEIDKLPGLYLGPYRQDVRTMKCALRVGGHYSEIRNTVFLKTVQLVYKLLCLRYWKR